MMIVLARLVLLCTSWYHDSTGGTAVLRYLVLSGRKRPSRLEVGPLYFSDLLFHSDVARW